MIRLLALINLMFAFMFSGFSLQAQEKMTAQNQSDHVLIVPNQLVWRDGPASLPKSLQAVIIEGDPSKPGPFTLRFKLPAYYRIPPHWHPAIEHVTVISGSFYMGTGEKFDESNAVKLPIGGFAVMAIGTQHFGFTKSEGCVIQVHGVGPWQIIYVDPKEDPRNLPETGRALKPRGDRLYPLTREQKN